MVINQGDIFWIDFNHPEGSEPGYRHPHLVIQNNLFNHSRINTVVVCTLTSNMKRAGAPGNITLSRGEANLPKKNVDDNDPNLYGIKDMALLQSGELSFDFRYTGQGMLPKPFRPVTLEEMEDVIANR